MNWQRMASGALVVVAGIVLIVDDPPRTWYCVNRAVLGQLSKGLAGLPVPFDSVRSEPVAG